MVRWMRNIIEFYFIILKLLLLPFAKDECGASRDDND